MTGTNMRCSVAKELKREPVVRLRDHQDDESGRTDRLQEMDCFAPGLRLPWIGPNAPYERLARGRH